eukprot:140622_1
MMVILSSHLLRVTMVMKYSVNALAKKLQFSGVANYIVAKNMIVDLFQDDPFNDNDKTEYTYTIGGIDYLIASVSSTTLQSLRSVVHTLDDLLENEKQRVLLDNDWNNTKINWVRLL